MGTQLLQLCKLTYLRTPPLVRSWTKPFYSTFNQDAVHSITHWLADLEHVPAGQLGLALDTSLFSGQAFQTEIHVLQQEFRIRIQMKKSRDQDPYPDTHNNRGESDKLITTNAMDPEMNWINKRFIDLVPEKPSALRASDYIACETTVAIETRTCVR